ncbi:MAG: hypothetical protein JXA54_12975 [Candidatus Heimdallarchaeota archaeon]|nr:hypothetical protein [Candidatus Heimdallarchaeota archaeon]
MNSSSNTYHSFYLNGSLLYTLLEFGEPNYSSGFEIVDVTTSTSPIYKSTFIADDSYSWWYDSRESGHEIIQFKDDYVFFCNGNASNYMQWMRIIDRSYISKCN